MRFEQDEDTVKLSHHDLDVALGPIGLSYEDLNFALMCPGPLSEVWFKAAYDRLEEVYGTTTFVIESEPYLDSEI